MCRRGEAVLRVRERMQKVATIKAWRSWTRYQKQCKAVGVSIRYRFRYYAQRRCLLTWRRQSQRSHQLRSARSAVAELSARRLAASVLAHWRARSRTCSAATALASAAGAWHQQRVGRRCLVAWLQWVRRAAELRSLRTTLVHRTAVYARRASLISWHGRFRSRMLLRRAWLGWKVAVRRSGVESAV